MLNGDGNKNLISKKQIARVAHFFLQHTTFLEIAVYGLSLWSCSTFRIKIYKWLKWGWRRFMGT